MTDLFRFLRLVRFMSGELSDQWTLAKLRQNRRTVSPDCRDGYLKMFRSNFVDEVQGQETPCLVVIGANDPGLDEAAMRSTILSWRPDGELVTIPNCGHYPMQECPPWFATVVERFLRRHAG